MWEKIKAFVMDVDGTLTNGKLYIGECGEVFKAFNVRDGYGIRKVLPAHGVKTVIITGRESNIVTIRARELNIDYVFQNVEDKKTELEKIANELNCELSQIAYIGDDLNDIPAMKICGLKGCPADAMCEVQSICDYVSTQNGGNGAVRDFIEWIISRL